MSKDEIFALINNKETNDACEKLQITADVSSKFKDAYFEYKALSKGKWKLSNQFVFDRLDRFSERIQDMLNVCADIVEFNRLEMIEIGGSRGKVLSESLTQIFNEFEEAVSLFTSISYDIFDLNEEEEEDQRRFESDFNTFKAEISELELRIASIFTRSFDNFDTVSEKFTLLESFQGLLSRPAISDQLELKYIDMVQLYRSEL